MALFWSLKEKGMEGLLMGVLRCCSVLVLLHSSLVA